MNSLHDYFEVEGATCHVCQSEVSDASALSVEGQEYLYFFCGQGCYEQWQQMNNDSTD